ncbi:hypothetical protein [Zooshikella ganghwensis]|uniref:hypothetical protein n=1 Tax=Zooshikella ganghwensis TaxID=202772 RepID=UPI00040107EE|nr:hypothetical protein [Zooshikella ganghwensis]
MNYTKLLAGLMVGLSLSISVFAEESTPQPITLYGGFTLERNGSFTSTANLSCTSGLEVNVVEKASSSSLVYLSINPRKDCGLIPFKQEFTVNLKELLVYDGKSTNGLDKKFIVTNPIILDINHTEEPVKTENKLLKNGTTREGHEYIVKQLGIKKVSEINPDSFEFEDAVVDEIQLVKREVKGKRYRFKNACEIRYKRPGHSTKYETCFVNLDS